jgi:hypothetical protein
MQQNVGDWTQQPHEAQLYSGLVSPACLLYIYKYI